MNKTPYKDIVEIADTYGVEAAILLTSCESEIDVQWARISTMYDEISSNIYEKCNYAADFVIPDYNKKPLYYSRPSFEIKSSPRQIVIKGRSYDPS